MKITISTNKLITEVETALVEYRQAYVKAYEAYHIKMGEYVKYLDKKVEEMKKKNAPITIKGDPNPPYFQEDTFTTALTALKAHIGEYVDLTDREYHDLKKGLEDQKRHMIASLNTIEELSYND